MSKLKSLTSVHFFQKVKRIKMKTRDRYFFYKKELSKLLKALELVPFYKDEVVLDKLINLLTEGKSVGKIRGIISTTLILKYGGDISEEAVEEIYFAITEWWKEKKQII